jgi:hypothetical protein
MYPNNNVMNGGDIVISPGPARTPADNDVIVRSYGADGRK